MRAVWEESARWSSWNKQQASVDVPCCPAWGSGVCGGAGSGTGVWAEQGTDTARLVEELGFRSSASPCQVQCTYFRKTGSVCVTEFCNKGVMYVITKVLTKVLFIKTLFQRQLSTLGERGIPHEEQESSHDRAKQRLCHQPSMQRSPTAKVAGQRSCFLALTLPWNSLRWRGFFSLSFLKNIHPRATLRPPLLHLEKVQLSHWVSEATSAQQGSKINRTLKSAQVLRPLHPTLVDGHYQQLS